MGLGFGVLNSVRPIKQRTFFENVMPYLASPVFATSLKHQVPGSYDIGYIDKRKHTGELVYTSVNNTEGFWGITLSGYQVGNGTTVHMSFDAVADTGTTLAILPDPLVRDYYSKVPGATHHLERVWYVPCNTTLPDLGLVINDNYTVSIPGEYIRYSNPDPKVNNCYGGVQAARNGAVLGSMFLKTQYVVFDYGQLRLGFAAQAKGNETRRLGRSRGLRLGR
ncbi:hypothetical protein PRK78_001962 [Emydomyces testavorans]|uniref:Peptidase A1 domain-containing protein n=1 Tax=Emydomyces testavorans TaxID=2070801 RepID=A0AAF0IH65_9EURO|nr:hypothetical protein PRK78_001962 [Emydomyces testavorans]